MQMTFWPFWLMMVSMATAVLPVWRSPMMSSRWPRPMGIMASMALMPVWSDSRTDWRFTMPGAITSIMPGLLGSDGALAVDGLADAVHHAAHDGVAHGDLGDPLGPLDDVAFADLGIVAHEHRAHVLLFEVQGHAHDAAGELQKLAGHDVVESVDLGDTVTNGDHGPDFGDLDGLLEIGYLLFYDLADFLCFDLHL